MPRAESTANIAEALRKNSGNIAHAAKSIGYHRSSLWKRIQKSPELMEVYEDEQETAVDYSESALRRGVLAGESWAVMYTLNNSPAAKRRGWGPRQEVTGASGNALQIVIKYADA